MFTSFRATTLLVMLFALALFANAQPDAVRAHIPFSFSAGNTVLPAGDYLIDTIAGGGGLIVRGTTVEAVATVLSVSASPSAGHIGLSFVHRGSEYILSAVQMPNGRINLPTTFASPVKALSSPMTSATILPRQ